MIDKDIIKFAWMSLWRRKLRTILTLIGIMIGTAGIITMVSLGIGLEKSVTGEFEGSNMTSIEVYPGEDMGPSGAETVKVLKDDNVNKIKQMDGVKAVTPIYQTYGELTIGRETIDATYTGIDMTEAEELGYKLVDGRFPRSSEVILGSNLLEQLVSRTGKDNFLRKSAKIILSSIEGNVESTEFRTRVGGILESSGGAEDYSVTMDVDKLVEYVEKSTNEKNIIDNQGYSSIKVVATDMDVMDSLSREINDAGYMSFSMKDILESIGSVFKFVQLFLGGVGSIALVVAAVGITNTMIMSTYERTKEIGVNKVIGASIKDIRKQFLYEATFIGLLGGISGLIFSYILSMIINFIATMSLQGETTIKVTQIPIWLALFAIVFSTIVGILAGLYPANKAAKISVLEALRTE
ncbi:ABC transporter permease [Clostridium sp. D2Q-11]|uniref:ABC transporter permease n=1 Tax=Anaeromonas frigoriresistens TaxID=2683708 RepID=A0A942Z985_9FIRM|nr:FtsX-like permease family protein [Anaeromonas frigoriresistens]MBS4539063.1 ABC transporter permease [Anaeromonas frigoriresistens]